MLVKIAEYRVCRDCLCYIANGDDTALDLLDEQDAAAIRQERDSFLDNLAPGVHLHTTDVEHGFCHSNCDICDALPGDRYGVAAYQDFPMDDKVTPLHEAVYEMVTCKTAPYPSVHFMRRWAINLLANNDLNGTYTDEDSVVEFGAPASLDSLFACIVRQFLERN